MSSKKKTEGSRLLRVRNSSAEFLAFTAETSASSVEVLYQNEMIWASQKMIADLFDTTKNNVSMHLKNLYASGELDPASTVKDFLTVQKEGSREIEREQKFYRLDAIVAVGFKVNSDKAIQFRQWAGVILSEYTLKGYVLDNERMKNGAYLAEDYFEHLLDEIREIRESERRFYQKITDIYTTSMDYNPQAPTTKKFFSTVQNKLHYAVHGHTAAEVIMDRADAEMKNMGLATWKNAPSGKVVRSDVVVAKNYLDRTEISALSLIVSMYLDYAERQAQRKIPMTMEDWAERLDAFLRFNEEDVLDNPGTVTAEMAKSFALSEFERYRIKQDALYQSDFDRFLSQVEPD